ncbi:MAG: thiamine-phosphate kinase [Proteobacteria bacterium]|nr:thiamine-phosphate kinase [Pseudomonadota bacterium]
MTVGKIGEFGLISRLTGNMKPPGSHVIQGIGDDTAVLRFSKDRLILATCDVQIEGIHFISSAFLPEQIGYRAAAVNLSDIAAMGGTPTFAVVSLAVPKETKVDTISGIYTGLQTGLEKWGAEIVGGNTAELPERIAIDVTLMGEVDPNLLLLRSGAEPGDILCVTGDLGASAAGLKLLERPSLRVEEKIREQALQAHCTPVPRIPEARFLAKTGNVTACIDVSDGVRGDAAHIADKSGVAVHVELNKIPVAEAAIRVADAAGLDAHRLAISGGEDFELLFTIRHNKVDDVLKELELGTGTKATAIGEIKSGPAEVQIEKEGQPIDFPAGGFDHFDSK